MFVTPGDYILSATVISILLGAIVGWRIGIIFFLSVGMIMIYTAFLQYINFNGSWPSNQPRVEYYQPSKEKMDKLDSLLYTIDGKSNGFIDNKSDMEDWKRCRYLNVCVRKLKDFAEPR